MSTGARTCFALLQLGASDRDTGFSFKWQQETTMNRQSRENLEILELRRAHPELAASEIARKYHKSRQRVHQILKKARLTSPRDRLPCYRCVVCGKLTHQQWFCSRACRTTFSHIPVICANCGKLSYFTLSEVLDSEHSFCGPECRAEWRTTHPRLNAKKA